MVVSYARVAGLLVALVACNLGERAAAVADDKYVALEKWVVSNGGKVKTRIGTNKQGYRGLFAKEDIPSGEPIVSVPGSCMLNAGSTKGSFLTPSLSLLREWLHPHSRLQPYLDVMPPRDSVVTACTLDTSLWPLMESEYWSNFMSSWQSFLQRAIEGKANLDLEYTIDEMLGNTTVTLDDLKQACAMSATRYVESGERGRLMMIPLFDMANHKLECHNYLTGYADSNIIHFIAGTDIKAGDEICYGYGAMRDDYSLIHYGFLPDLEHNPRLLVIDHHQFDMQLHHQQLTEEIFQGDAAQTAAEIARLKAIQHELKRLDDEAKASGSRPAKGASEVTDMLLELQARRRTAVNYEINRLEASLKDGEL